MCVIIDANVVGEIFGGSLDKQAAKEFFAWLKCGKGRLVAGGKLLEELKCDRSFMEWADTATKVGSLRLLRLSDVASETERLCRTSSMRSNDPHVLAVAMVSGSRLLYSNDEKLCDDFKNLKLVNSPKGKVFTTKKSPKYDSAKRSMLTRGLKCGDRSCRTRRRS